MGGGQHVLQPVLDPAHGCVELQGQGRTEMILGITADLHPEATADVGSDHPHLIFAEPQHGRYLAPHLVGSLGAGVEDDATGGRVGGSQHGPPLQRKTGQALIDHRSARKGKLFHRTVRRPLPYPPCKHPQ